MTAQGDKYRNRPDEDQSTRRTAEEELMRGDRGVGISGGGQGGGSGTAEAGLENEATGSLMIDDAGREEGEGSEGGDGRSGPIRSETQKDKRPDTGQDRDVTGDHDANTREGYEDHGGSRDDDGTRGESSGSRPGYR